MSCRYSLERLMRCAALAAVFCLQAALAIAAPKAVQPFSADTWTTMTASSAAPALVVFSATDCAHCPGVIERLAAAAERRRARVPLVVVVMDGAGVERQLLTERHYRRADALYAFDGDALAIRHAVDASWRGITPYVAMIAAGGAVRFHAGEPPAAMLKEFLRR